MPSTRTAEMDVDRRVWRKRTLQYRWTVIAGIVAQVTLFGCSAVGDSLDTLTPPLRDCLSVPFVSGVGGYQTYRIPAVAWTPGGVVIAAAEGRRDGPSDSGEIDIVARRSTDGGCTWSAMAVVQHQDGYTVGNPTLIATAQGSLIMLSTRNVSSDTEEAITAGVSLARRTVWIQNSSDEGQTWSAAREITDDAALPEWRWYATGPGSGVELKSGPHAGRLVVAGDHSVAPPPGSTDTGSEPIYLGNHVIYSDDAGRNWSIGYTSETPTDGAINLNETSLAELPGGRLLLSARNQKGTVGHRLEATLSEDQEHLTIQWHPGAVTGPVVHTSLASTPNSNAVVFAGPQDPEERENMALYFSCDEGTTWSELFALAHGPAAYSALAISPDGAWILLAYETGETMPYEKIAAQTISTDLLACR